MKSLITLTLIMFASHLVWAQEAGEESPIQPAPEIQAPPVEVQKPVPTPFIETKSKPTKASVNKNKANSKSKLSNKNPQKTKKNVIKNTKVNKSVKPAKKGKKK